MVIFAIGREFIRPLVSAVPFLAVCSLADPLGSPHSRWGSPIRQMRRLRPRDSNEDGHQLQKGHSVRYDAHITPLGKPSKDQAIRRLGPVPVLS